MISDISVTGRTILALSAVLAGTAVHAQQAQPGSGGLEEIIVTAQRREQRLLDVPVAVTAINADEIAARGVTSLQDMQYSVPGLTMAETGPGLGRLQLNGIGIAGGSTGAPAVGRYLDEIAVTSLSGGSELDLRLLDMERIEVLHGPQPTLYGQGSMGGTMHFVTASPDLKEFGGYAAGSWGSISDGASSYTAHAVLNAPIIDDKLGVRVAAGYEKVGGWVDSSFTGKKDVNDVEIKTIRAKLLYKPVEDLSVSFLYLHQQHDQPYQNFGTLDRVTEAAYPTFNEDKYDLGNLVVSYDLGSATLLSSTGYYHRQPTSAYDLTASFLPFLSFFPLPPEVLASIETIGYPLQNTINVFSQELRLASNGTGPFNYVVGAYYRDYRYNGRNRTVTAPGTLPFDLIDIRESGSSLTWAAFSEARYAFNDRLEALIGLRYFEDQRDQITNAAGVFVAPGRETNKETFSSTNPRFNLSYKTSPDGLVYVNAAKGFRSGVFNSGGAPGTPTSAGPESLWTYELGTKQMLLEGRVLADFSVFYNEWSDIQAVAVVDGNPLGYITNSGKASGPGFNFSLMGKPTPELTLSATLGYTDMQYDTNSAGRFKGDPLDMVAEWTYSLAADFRKPLTVDTTLLARVDFGHTDGYQLTIRDFPGPQQIFPVESRDLLNARVGAEFGKYQAFLYADNLTDDNGTLYPAVGAFPEPVLSTPRTIGVEVRVGF